MHKLPKIKYLISEEVEGLLAEEQHIKQARLCLQFQIGEELRRFLKRRPDFCFKSGVSSVAMVRVVVVVTGKCKKGEG